MEKKFVEVAYTSNKMYKVQKITLSAMLAALSLVFVLFMPTIDLVLWSFTPFSHLFLFLAIFISPYTGLMTYFTVFFGFVLKGANPLILLRAGSHIFFTLSLILVIKLRPIKSMKSFAFWAVIIGLIHAIAEILSVVIGLAAGLPYPKYVTDQNVVFYILLALGGGSLAHSLLDMFAAYAVLLPLKKAFPKL